MNLANLSALCFVMLFLNHIQANVMEKQQMQQGADFEIELQKLKSYVDDHISENLKKQKLMSKELQSSKEFIQKLEGKIRALQKELQPRKDIPVQVQEKRSDDNPFDAVLSHMTQELNRVAAEVQALKNAEVLRLQNTGNVYTRWGHAACPNSTETVYSAMTGGSWYDTTGSAATSLCLPHTPVFDSDDHKDTLYGHADLYGAEYQTCNEPECDMTIACAVCRTPRTSVVMVPATNICQPGWNLEYSGYLMAGHPVQKSATEFICVDRSHGYIESTQGNQNGRLLYYTVAHCASLSCPPYQDEKIVLCSVCSK